MPAYVDQDYVSSGSYIMLPGEIEEVVEATDELLVDRVALAVSRLFDSYLIKRYAAPFESPYPEALRDAVAREVVRRLWYLHGGAPQSTDKTARIEKAAEDALAWMREAANSKDGFVELPRREDTADGEGVTRGGPLAQSDASPYDWVDAQAEALRGR